MQKVLFKNGYLFMLVFIAASMTFFLPALKPVSAVYGYGGGGIIIPATPKIGDITGDNIINEYDLAILMADWSQTGSILPADLNHNGVVDEYDFALLMANWSL